MEHTLPPPYLIPFVPKNQNSKKLNNSPPHFAKFSQNFLECSWNKFVKVSWKKALVIYLSWNWEIVYLSWSKNNLISGNAHIVVICDGGWGKRSYGKKFNSLSGCAVLIGVRTKKVGPFWGWIRRRRHGTWHVQSMQENLFEEVSIFLSKSPKQIFGSNLQFSLKCIKSEFWNVMRVSKNKTFEDPTRL